MRLDECYVSVQGEGPRVGNPTTFVRFGGCNLRCDGWPCDTQHAIQPVYRNTWERLTPAAVAERVKPWPVNVCITGGEPMLQKTEEMEELVDILIKRGHVVEMFSNGTLDYGKVLDEVYLVMDWKLPGSGEYNNEANAHRLQVLENLTMLDAVKFTIADSADFDKALEIWTKFIEPIDEVRRPQIFAGVVWDKLDNNILVDWMLEAKVPWRHNMQVHNYIWDREKRGI